MYKRNPEGWVKHFDFLLIDLIIFQVAYLLAQLLRNGRLFPKDIPVYITVNVVILVSGFVASILLDSHKSILKRSVASEITHILQQVFVVTIIILITLFFADHDGLFSRLVVVFFALLSAIFLFAVHHFWKNYLIRRHKTAVDRRHMLLVTTKALARQAVETMTSGSINDIHLNGVVIVDDDRFVGQEIDGIRIVTDMDHFLSYLLDKWVDEVMLYLEQESDFPRPILNQCLEMGITTHLRLHLSADRNSMQTIEKVAGCIVLTESIRITSMREQILKRLMDIAGSLVGLAITGILAVIFKIIIQIADPGPVFFSQKRIGQNGRPFNIYKFRTMYMDAEKRKADYLEKNEMKGNMFKLKHDPRIIGSGPDGKRKGYGYVLRTTSLDEFPQFFNVLKGDMSLVGTRPPLVEEWKNYEAHHRVRMAVKPGLTGLWQISGRNKVTDFEDVIAYDREYINNWSLGGDLLIILKTIGTMFRGEGY